jgi:hypothetical protein
MHLTAELERGAAYDRRRYLRHATALAGGLAANLKTSIGVTITDLSVGGCGIALDVELDKGARVWIRLPGLENRPARVIWTAHERAGLAFDQPLHPAVVARYVQGSS